MHTSKWFSQRSLDWRATVDNKSTTYFDGDSSNLAVLLHLQLLVMKLALMFLHMDSWH
jgi:hypothetical protein